MELERNKMKLKWFSARFRFFIPIVRSVLAKERNISQLLFLFAVDAEFGKRMKMGKISTRHISLSEAETAHWYQLTQTVGSIFFSRGSGILSLAVILSFTFVDTSWFQLVSSGWVKYVQNILDVGGVRIGRMEAGKVAGLYVV